MPSSKESFSGGIKEKVKKIHKSATSKGKLCWWHKRRANKISPAEESFASGIKEKGITKPPAKESFACDITEKIQGARQNTYPL